MTRLFNIFFSLISLIILSPILITSILIIWLQDGRNPFYLGSRVGKNHKIFKMIKLRSMYINSEKKGIDSTKVDDERITQIGKVIRRYKIDEIFQLLNVLKGDMNLVGPRPNVKRDVDIYTVEEKKILNILPGVTDFSSIVFSDEGEILKGVSDPDLEYNRIIRPWKSRLALFYIDKKSFFMDIKILYLTMKLQI